MIFEKAASKLMTRSAPYGLLGVFAFIAICTHLGYLFLVVLPPPSWIDTNDIPRIIDASTRIIAPVQIVCSFLLFSAVLFSRLRWKSIIPILTIYGAGFLIEFCATQTGFPFGAFKYTDLLGVKWFGIVPAVIPLSWCNILIPSFILSTWIVGQRGNVLKLFFFSILFVITWDLTIDPVMGNLYKYWQWAEPGLYYGIPLTNFLGWFFVSVLGTAILLAFGAREYAKSMPKQWIFAYYLTNILYPFGISLAAGQWLAVLLSLAILFCLGSMLVRSNLRLA